MICFPISFRIRARCFAHFPPPAQWIPSSFSSPCLSKFPIKRCSGSWSLFFLTMTWGWNEGSALLFSIEEGGKWTWRIPDSSYSLQKYLDRILWISIAMEGTILYLTWRSSPIRVIESLEQGQSLGNNREKGVFAFNTKEE